MDSDSTLSDAELADMKNMVLCFRVSELQVLLGHAGKTRSGRKHELMTNALQLIKSPHCDRSVVAKVLKLYEQRFSPDQPLVRASQHSSTIGQIIERSSKLTNSNPVSPPNFPKVKKQDSSIKFRSLPFYEHVSDVMLPKAMTPKSSKPMQDTFFKFRLTSQQGSKIQSGKTKKSKHQIKFDIQVQLRFCLLNTSCEQDDVLPSNLSVKVNRSFVTLPPFIPPTNTGQIPKRINRPIDITLNCLPLLSPDEHYTLEIKWSGENHELLTNDRGYGVTINLVQQLNVDDLLRKLNQVALIPSSVCRAVIKEKLAGDPESDIATTSLKVSLLCPLGKMRMKLPVRPSTCKHLQCFDATTFVLMNEKKPTWICPVCDKPAVFSTLSIDGLFVEILKSCSSDEINFTEDGNWHCPKQKIKAETLVIGTPMKSIDLSDSDTKVVEQKKNDTIVIDLTCDSSDDEPALVPSSRSPFFITDGTPMSICSSPGPIGNLDANMNTRTGAPCHDTSSSRKRQRSTSPLTHHSSTRSPYEQNTNSSHHPLRSTKSILASRNPPSLKQPPITAHFPRSSHNHISDASSHVPTPPLPSSLPVNKDDSLQPAEGLDRGSGDRWSSFTSSTNSAFPLPSHPLSSDLHLQTPFSNTPLPSGPPPALPPLPPSIPFRSPNEPFFDHQGRRNNP